MYRVTLKKFGLLMFIVTSIFILFQMMSMKMLNKTDKILEIHNEVQQHHQLEVFQGNPKVLNVVKYRKTYTKETVDNAIPQHNLRGVLPQQQILYEPDSNGMFKCLFSKNKILSKYVNDDYCDCLDSSDEPGTSACPQSRFYCQYQLPGIVKNKELWVYGSRVNDGICDCCDGSDEWEHVILSSDLQIKGANQSPCHNNCQFLIQKWQKAEKLRHDGAKLKQSYIDYAKQYSITDKKYGPQGEFYKVAQFCKEFTLREFVFVICPFGTAKQTAHGPERVIGREGHWIDSNKKLLMDNGDTNQCPGHITRTTAITFQCGLEDRIVTIAEDEVCKYLVQWETPAAC